MFSNVPKAKDLPIVAPDGNLAVNPGKYARGAIALAFEMVGGVEAFAEWAEDNPDEFYTKMFTKIVGREMEIGVSEGVESLLDALDNGALDGDIIEGTAQEIDFAEVEEVSGDHVKAKLLLRAAAYAEGEPEND